MIIPITKVKLLDGEWKQRFNLNRSYIMSLKNENLLQNHYSEAGLYNPWWGVPEDSHGGWENPFSSVRGQFLGHFMSAAAKLYCYCGDQECKLKLDQIVDGLEQCQKQNGGQWVHSCPDKYLHWLLEGRLVGVPHYTIHKTMLGLWDGYCYGKNKKALNILLRFTEYFIQFAAKLTDQEMDDVLDFETGGMMEIFACIYGETRDQRHLELMRKYERRRLFRPLLDGKDVLTNMHANTTVPEVLGAAAAYSATGERYYFDVVKAYWKCAVTDRSYYPTSGANSGEIWCPRDDFASRLGTKNQEHCTQYNMIRLANFLYQQEGDSVYGDYIEKSLYNSIFAQQNPHSGMVAYYLPMLPGAKKEWSTPTKTFWCCNGSLVQAHTQHPEYLAYRSEDGVILSQYTNASFDFEYNSELVRMSVKQEGQGGDTQKLSVYHPGVRYLPGNICYKIEIDSHSGQFLLRMRIPTWQTGIFLSVNGRTVETVTERGYLVVRINSGITEIELYYQKRIMEQPLPDNQNLVTFTDGPYVLAALSKEEILIPEDYDVVEHFRPVDARHWNVWRNEYMLQLPDRTVAYQRICDIAEEEYTIYARRL